MRALWPGTGLGWAWLCAVVVSFFVLDVLALLGSELALELLVLLGGSVVGAALAYPVAVAMRGWAGRGGMGGLFGFLAGLASVFGIVFAGAALAGIPAFPTAESGNLGAFIYGVALGFGLTVMNLSLGSTARREHNVEDSKVVRKVALISGGVVVGLLALTFVASVLIEHVLGPLIRQLAA